MDRQDEPVRKMKLLPQCSSSLARERLVQFSVETLHGNQPAMKGPPGARPSVVSGTSGPAGMKVDAWRGQARCKLCHRHLPPIEGTRASRWPMSPLMLMAGSGGPTAPARAHRARGRCEAMTTRASRVGGGALPGARRARRPRFRRGSARRPAGPLAPLRRRSAASGEHSRSVRPRAPVHHGGEHALLQRPMPRTSLR